MNRVGLPKLYDVLTPEERFRLMLHARAREDRAEFDRLERTCPRHTYTLRDTEYLNRRELIETITLAVCLDLTQYVAKLQVAAAFGWAGRELRERVVDRAGRTANRLHRKATNQFEADLAEDWREASSLLVGHALDPVQEIAGSLTADLARQARGVWDGFARFCRSELDVLPETVIAAVFAPMLAPLEALRDKLTEAEPDPVMVEEYERTLTEGWRRILGIETSATTQSDGRKP